MTENSSASENQKVVLITGANSGIGETTAIHLASLGYHLALNDISTSNLDHVKLKCQDVGLSSEKVLLVQGDVTKEDDLQRIISSTLEQFQRIDVLINNAAIVVQGNLEDCSMEDYDRVMNTNLRGPVQLSKLCLPHLIKTKGSIINMSSVWGFRSNPMIMFYGMAKAAMNLFTQSLAEEVAPKGVRVNCVNPGVIDTGIMLKAGYSQEQYDQYMKRMADVTPIGRVGQAEDVAKAVAFLISEDASFIVGSSLVVDGGPHIPYKSFNFSLKSGQQTRTGTRHLPQNGDSWVKSPSSETTKACGSKITWGKPFWRNFHSEEEEHKQFSSIIHLCLSELKMPKNLMTIKPGEAPDL